MTAQPDAASPSKRAKRPEPERTGPDRTGWSAASGPDVSAPQGQVEDIVGNAVRMGYSVIEEHLRHGRDAAERVRAGSYGTGDVPDDLSQLGRRVLQAARDFSGMWFEFLDAALRDPRLASALKKGTQGGTGGAPAKPGRPGATVTLTCSFPGKPGTVLAATLVQPDAPAMLATAGLHAPDPKLPAITSVAFLPNASGVVAVIRIPPDQPPGTYSGIVSDAGSHAPLGTLSIRVDQ